MTHLQAYFFARRLRRRLVPWDRAAFGILLTLATLLAATLSTAPAGAFGVLQTIQHPMTGVDGLDGIEALTVSPDGRHLYTSGLDAVMVFERDAVNGTLIPIQTLRADGAEGFGIFFLSNLIISPDGLYVYGGSTTESALAVFQRDPSTGRLAFTENIRNGQNGVDGLGLLVDLAMSPDGRQVLVLAFSGKTLGVFSRNITSGSLQLIDLENAQGEISELVSPRALAVAPDGGQVYVADRFEGVLSFDRNPDSGELTYAGAFDNPEQFSPMDVALSPDGQSLYASGFSNLSGGSVLVFDRDPMSGALTFNSELSGLEAETDLTLDSNGDSLYLTDNSRVVALERDNQGNLSLRQTLQQGVDGVEGLIESGLGVLDPQDRHLYVPSFTDEAVAIFERTAANGELTFVDAIFDGEGETLDGLGGPAFLHAPRDGRDLYVMNRETKILAQYRRDTAGRLSLGQVTSLLDLGLDDFEEIYRLTGSPDGNFLIVVDEFKELWTFRRDQGNGSLQLVNRQFLELQDFFEIVFSFDSRFVLIAGGGNLSIHRLNPATGALDLPLTTSSDLSAFNQLAISPDNRFIYSSDGSPELGAPGLITTHAFDAMSGALTYVDEISSPALGGLARQLTMTPDGRFLIANGFDTNDATPPGLVVFARDSATGALSEVQTLLDGIGGLEGFAEPIMGELSHDGAYLIVEGTHRTTRQVTSTFLQRDAQTGRLTVIEQRVEGDGTGPTEIASYRDAVWSPDGDQFYLTSTLGDTLFGFDASVSGVCQPSPAVLCLGHNGRFRVEASWTDFVGASGIGTKVTETVDSGLFWFFDDANWEMLVKVIDGCDFNDHFWVFAAATTNVAYTLTVTDTQSGIEAVYANTLGTSSPAITDTEAIATCP